MQPSGFTPQWSRNPSQASSGIHEPPGKSPRTERYGNVVAPVQVASAMQECSGHAASITSEARTTGTPAVRCHIMAPTCSTWRHGSTRRRFPNTSLLAPRRPQRPDGPRASLLTEAGTLGTNRPRTSRWPTGRRPAIRGSGTQTLGRTRLRGWGRTPLGRTRPTGTTPLSIGRTGSSAAGSPPPVHLRFQAHELPPFTTE